MQDRNERVVTAEDELIQVCKEYFVWVLDSDRRAD